MDIIKFEILEDGTISIQTDDLSGPNHVSADQLLKAIANLAGGQVVKKKRWDKHQHVHRHGHVDQGHGHSHGGHSH